MRRDQSQHGRTQLPSSKDGGVRQEACGGTLVESRLRVRTCVRAHRGTGLPRFRRALETDSPSLATAAAYELAQLNLADALRLCLVFAHADRPRFDRAIVRWHA
jgi:hypothetical protein